MGRLLVTPRWLGFAALAVALAVVFVQLGLWQLDRRESRLDRNSRVIASREAAPVPVDAVLATDRPVADDDQYRPVTATGTYLSDDEYLVAGRSLDSRVGFLVLTPLVTDTGGTLLVVRGWVPAPSAGADVPPEVPDAPSGEVTVEGRVRPSEAGRGAVREAALGSWTSVRVIDVAGIAGELNRPTYGGYVELVTQEPAADPGLSPLPLPVVDEGPHLSYGVQWFLFAALAIGAYVWFARAEARRGTSVARTSVSG